MNFNDLKRGMYVGIVLHGIYRISNVENGVITTGLKYLDGINNDLSNEDTDWNIYTVYDEYMNEIWCRNQGSRG